MAGDGNLAALRCYVTAVRCCGKSLHYLFVTRAISPASSHCGTLSTLHSPCFPLLSVPTEISPTLSLGRLTVVQQSKWSCSLLTSTLLCAVLCPSSTAATKQYLGPPSPHLTSHMTTMHIIMSQNYITTSIKSHTSHISFSSSSWHWKYKVVLTLLRSILAPVSPLSSRLRQKPLVSRARICWDTTVTVQDSTAQDCSNTSLAYTFNQPSLSVI